MVGMSLQPDLKSFPDPGRCFISKWSHFQRLDDASFQNRVLSRPWTLLHFEMEPFPDPGRCLISKWSPFQTLDDASFQIGDLSRHWTMLHFKMKSFPDTGCRFILNGLCFFPFLRSSFESFYFRALGPIFSPILFSFLERWKSDLEKKSSYFSKGDFFY